MLKHLLPIGVLFIPIAAWAFVKPIQVVAPALAGLSCSNDTVCTDDMFHYQDAARLYDEALHFVESSVGSIKSKPRVIFCNTDACFQFFGLGKRSSATIGTFGIVISPRAWKRYYVRHEMIHHLQNEKLGMLKAWREPKWFAEGMAYSLGEAPSQKLSEPFEQYRSKFEVWYKPVGNERLWTEARKL